MKILIVRFSSIGDIVLTTPIIRALKLQLDHCEIHYATKSPYQSILSDNPYLKKVHLLENNLGDLIDQLRKEKFDLVIDLHKNVRTLFVKARLGVKSSSVKKLNLAKWLMVNFKLNKLPNRHIVDRYFDAVKHLAVKNDNHGLDYFIPDADLVEREWLPESHRKEYIVYAIGGKFGTKRLPVKRMIELCDKINKPIILLGGKEDFERGEEVRKFFAQTSDSMEESIKDKLGKKAQIFNGCGKFSINQSASLIKNSKVVFTHDTGMMHIAAAFKKKIFSIWGNTIPEFGMYPYMTQFTIFENKKIGCRPCSKLGFNQCPKGHFKCMNDLIFDFYIP